MAFVAERARRRGRRDSRDLHREISPLRDLRRDRPARAADPRASGRTILHTHTAKAGRGRPHRRAARRRRAAADRRPHVPRPRAARLLRPGSHARSSACSSGWLARVDRRARRRQPGGARRPRRARRRAAREVHGHPPRDRARGARRRRAATARDETRRVLGIPTGPLHRRLDRPHDRRQADGRRAARVQARCATRGVDACLCMVGDGPDRDAGRAAARTSSGSSRDCALPRLPGGRRAVLRRVRRARAAVGERGHAGERDRGARGAAARSSRRASAACPTSSATARTASSSSPATSTRWPSALARLAARPRAARADGRGRPRARARRATPSSASSTTSTRSTARCSPRDANRRRSCAAALALGSSALTLPDTWRWLSDQHESLDRARAGRPRPGARLQQPAARRRLRLLPRQRPARRSRLRARPARDDRPRRRLPDRRADLRPLLPAAGDRRRRTRRTQRSWSASAATRGSSA